MKAFCFIAITIALLSTQMCFAQTQTLADRLCSQPQQRQKLLLEHPEILQLEEQFENYTHAWVENYKKGKTERSATGRIIIPLVFHVINEGGTENISDAQLIDEVRILNRDYNKQNADTSQVVGDFKYIIADMGVEWRLARLDPKGNCTNGIDRITSDQTYVGDDYSKLNAWPREKYVNVWLIGQFQIPGAAGYAYYPIDVNEQFNMPSRDGVIILSNYMGSIGTGSDFTSKALTHEIGHCFNLAHCWGNTNDPMVSCGDDGVDDTPVTMGWLHCPNVAAADVCNAGVTENYQNYMEYSYCSVMFTEGQKARWLAAANSPIAGRNNLWSDSNLIATGTYDTLPTPCAPIAAFSANLRYVCASSAVKFLNSSGNGSVTSNHWTFPAGTTYIGSSSDTSTNPTVEFNTPGWQVVTLTVANSQGSSTLTDSLLVYVSKPTATISVPYYQGFEDPNIFSESQPNGWTSLNYDANNHYDNNMTWFSQTTVAAHNGNGSAELNNYHGHANFDIDEIVSPAINMSNATASQLTLSFYYSFASANQYLDNLADSIAVYASSNCGSSWYQLSGNVKLGNSRPNFVLNAGYVPDEFIPTKAPVYWKQVTMTIPGSMVQPNVHFKIRAFTSIHGNNLFIDDVNIGNAPVPHYTGAQQLSAINNASLFPNPTTGDATLYMDMAQSGKVSVRVYDLTGKMALSAFEGWMNEGENNVSIAGYSKLSGGVYIVGIMAGESVVQKKLIVQ